MFRTRTAILSSIAAAGALLLTACNGDGSTGDGKAAAVSAAPQAQASTLSFTPGTAEENNAPANTGDLASNAKPSVATAKPVVRKWVQLSNGKAGDLNPVVINGAGFTLYRFDNDTASPSKSNCTGECAVTWPPYIVAKKGRVFVDRVPDSKIGFIPRAGGFQVTIGGQPVYLYSKDVKAGDTNGQGVNGTWFGVTPTGQKAVEDTTPKVITNDGGAMTSSATKARFFKNTNFADLSEPLTGPGCKTVHYSGSMRVSGDVKIWSGDNCTGKSQVVDSDVRDLSTIGFPTVKSVRFLNG
ncbi:putative lipoprotein with Yx(FWY)xxD motif [Streptomyces sp. B3I7]|uniref:COG4315 family predicted lipoprotein n=1 Tax=Streptomyces sp. B3I7 TaxID=3042269 RepID=UPI002783B6DF|nr:hypothetical protein [Streptomyces sp. B3I7]MDQ0808377.1 putative lipoprotein with Yx(FWY)xxD motif [Streptomyces sp. B3I7]